MLTNRKGNILESTRIHIISTSETVDCDKPQHGQLGYAVLTLLQNQTNKLHDSLLKGVSRKSEFYPTFDWDNSLSHSTVHESV